MYTHVVSKGMMEILFVYIIGNITIPDGMAIAVNSDFKGASRQFTLTCISVGGPATTVTWTRDSVTVTEGIETVLDDPVTAQYIHTLTITEMLGGLYTCTVANNRPSEDSAQLNFQGIHTISNGSFTDDILVLQVSVSICCCIAYLGRP